MATPRYAALAMLISTLISCGSSNTDKPNNSPNPMFGALLSSDQPRENPHISTENTRVLANDNLDFSIKLYKEIVSADDNNIAFAPYSISSAVSMLYAGAAGVTETDIKSTLNFTLPRETLFRTFNSTSLILESLPDNVEINIINNLWGQEGLAWNSDFVDVLAKNYGAGMNIVDFTDNPESIRTAVNSWVSESTNEKIRELLSRGTLSSETRFIITNAIYLNADWQTPFDTSNTSDKSFQLTSGDNTTVPTMSATLEIAHSRESYYDILELPYKGSNLTMVIIAPDADSLGYFEQELTRSLLHTAIEKLQIKQVALELPKFETSTNIPLGTTLTQLGMSSSFSDLNADFSRMADNESLKLTDVIHQVFVRVDENGTEAAAATGIVGSITSDPVADVTLRINQPFLFFIRDKITNTNLFVGRIMNPGI